MPESIMSQLIGQLPEAILVGTPDDGYGHWSKKSAEDILSIACIERHSVDHS
jgi:hypothetical protein